MRGRFASLLAVPGLLEDEFVHLGRLDEGEALEHDLARGKYLKLGAAALAWPRARSSRPSSASGTSFHFAHTSVSKAAGHPGAVPSAPTPDGRIYVYPGRGETSLARAAGAVYDRRAGAWWVRVGTLAEAALARLTGPAARSAWERRRLPGGRSQRATPGGFQRYVERARQAVERRDEIERDAEGPISFGSIGEREAERARFWEEAAAVERRDGRVQCRIIAELPHEVTAEGRRRIVEGFVAALRERGLPYHATVHRPDVSKGMDPRNVHLHVVYHDRPAERVGRDAWVFGSHKDRGARGPQWVRALRERLAEESNRELERESTARTASGGMPIARRLDPRSYREMGIDKPPGRHLGPVAAAYDRSGRPTARGVANAIEDAVWDSAERGRALAPLAERAIELRARADRLPEQPRQRLREDLEAVGRAIFEAAPRDPQRNERIVQRRDWAAAERRRLESAIGRHEARHHARASGGGPARGLATGERLEAMRRRLLRLAEIEAEATALLAAFAGAATIERAPVALAAEAIRRMLERVDHGIRSAQRVTLQRGRGAER